MLEAGPDESAADTRPEAGPDESRLVGTRKVRIVARGIVKVAAPIRVFLPSVVRPGFTVVKPGVTF